MKCPLCGEELNKKARVCPECGEPLKDKFKKDAKDRKDRRKEKHTYGI